MNENTSNILYALAAAGAGFALASYVEGEPEQTTHVAGYERDDDPSPVCGDDPG